MMILQRILNVEPRTNRIQTGFRWLLGAFLFFAGINHLTVARKEFQAQVPDWVPMDPDQVVVLSGIAEIGLGSSLLAAAKYRALIGSITAAFFVMIFPGNISQYVNRVDAFGLDTDQARGTRLLFQPVLVAWALWSTGAWQVWRESISEQSKHS
jgi:uncharacterized membrane protein